MHHPRRLHTSPPALRRTVHAHKCSEGRYAVAAGRAATRERRNGYSIHKKRAVHCFGRGFFFGGESAPLGRAWGPVLAFESKSGTSHSLDRSEGAGAAGAAPATCSDGEMMLLVMPRLFDSVSTRAWPEVSRKTTAQLHLHH